MRARYIVRRGIVLAATLLVVAGIAAGGYFGGRAVFGTGGSEAHGGSAPATPPPAPRIVVRRPHHRSSSDLGFPAFATRNTTRVGGVDPIADAAGVAAAAYPSEGGVRGPAAVTLVPADSWRDGIAAASLVAPPIGAPILISRGSEMPSVTADALRALAPEGSTATDGKRLFAIGGVAAPSGPTTERLGGADPATVAAGIARLRERLTHAPPGHIVIASADEPAFAMPAAAWAARSGDPVLFAGTGPPPVATLKTLHHYSGVPVYVLGPSSTISGRAFDLIRKVAPGAKRVEGADPVANSIAFARYVDGDFGWGLTDPGHGLVIANDARPLDAAAAAPLAATGIFGPLLVTSSATELPSELREYLLDLKPGYETDPTRAVFNHVWLLGDAGAVSVAVQSQIDDLVELVKIGSRAGSAASPPSQPRGSTKKP